ncbi:hypothetical protein, partial [Haloferax sp. Atlit-47N]|uniref:hypothetical protein n=1 Tax=Haloferax sp. Atlit-47N TaxID=2077199 RepID=UPI001F20571D
MFGAEWLETKPDERIPVHTHPSQWLVIKQVFLSVFMAINLVMLLFWDVTRGVEIFGYNARLLIGLAIPLVFIPVVTAQLR